MGSTAGESEWASQDEDDCDMVAILGRSRVAKLAAKAAVSSQGSQPAQVEPAGRKGAPLKARLDRTATGPE
jgi:hypothetical protein